MKLGVVLSAGGSAFGKIARITSGAVELMAVTTRPCGATIVATELGIPWVRADGTSRVGQSKAIAEVAHVEGLSSLLLNYDRLVTSELYDSVPTFNVHPAALPAFKGLHGVEDAYAAGACLIGCTLHKVDETMDGGPVVAQIVRSADPAWPLARWQKLAFLMKVYCGLAWIAGQMGTLRPGSGLNASHDLPPEWHARFLELQRAEGEAVMMAAPRSASVALTA